MFLVTIIRTIGHPITTTRYIAHNRAALLRLLAGLFATIGIAPGGSVGSLPRALRNRVLETLRPAEAALRRLLVVLARDVEVVLSPVRSPSKRVRKQSVAAERALAFPLFDKRKNFDERPQRTPVKGPGPRMFVIGVDDYEPYVPPPEPPEPTENDPLDAARLCKRLQAVQRALDDLPKQARRLARLIARRKAAGMVMRYTEPLRPGWPPGYRKRGRREVHEVLRTCDWLVRWSADNPDTG